jgi:hypothetical protein
MKKLFCIILGLAAIMACTKETDYSSNNEDLVSISENGQKTYSVTAYFEEITKATISETDGKFSWSGGEQIAIWDSAHDEFVTFDIDTYSNEGEKRARFTTTTAKDGASFVGNVAYYPASIATKTGSTPSYNFPTSFSSKDAAAKGFPMQGTVTGNEIKFSHLGSLINLTLNNVPSFTTKLILNDGTNNITVPVTPSAGVLNAVVPIPAGTYVLTAKLEDDNSNVFYSKARSSQAYSARFYYTINPISLGKLLTFTNEAGWDSPKVHIWQYGNSGNVDITTGGTYPHKLYLRNSNVYYVLLDSSVESWTAEGKAIGVQFVSTTNASNNTQTDCVFLLRNIDFRIADGGIKTDYYIYPFKNGSSTSVTIKTIPAIITNWDNNPRIHIWGTTNHNTDWDSRPYMSVSGSLAFYPLETNTPTVDFGFKITNDGGDSGDKTAHFSSHNVTTLDGDKLIEWNYSQTKDISLSASANKDNNFMIPAEGYGKCILLKLGSTTYWPIRINRDYDYGY